MTTRTQYQQLGWRIRAIRQSRGLTQRALAAAMGMTDNGEISVMERYGRGNITAAKLTRICAALDIFEWQLCASDWREQCGVTPEG